MDFSFSKTPDKDGLKNNTSIEEIYKKNSRALNNLNIKS
jgi:hypothetical protein